MNKKLFTQIRNEWRSNLWLALELLLVSVVMWYIIDLLYCRMATYLEPRGFDTEHCYLINMGVLTDKSPDYTPYSDTHKQSDEVRELVERLRRRPEVEVVSLSLSAYPYNGSNGSAEVDYDTLHAPRWTIRRIATPDFVRVFRYRGARGETRRNSICSGIRPRCTVWAPPCRMCATTTSVRHVPAIPWCSI